MAFNTGQTGGMREDAHHHSRPVVFSKDRKIHLEILAAGKIVLHVCDGHFKQTNEHNIVFCVHKAEFYTYIKFYGLIFNFIPFLCLFVIGSERCGEGCCWHLPH